MACLCLVCLALSRSSTLAMLCPEAHPRIGHTAISRKVVGENVHATTPKGNMRYDQYTVPDTVAVEPTFVAFF